MSALICYDAHQSGFHGVSQAEWTEMNRELAAHATVGVVTESKGYNPINGWKVVGDETKILYSTPVWSLDDSGDISIPTPEWVRGTSHRHTVEVTWALLVNKRNKVRLLRLGGHLPAHLDDKAQAAANLAALKGLPALVIGLENRLHPDMTTASFDFNRNLKRKAQRDIVSSHLGATGLRLVVPPKSTRGLRTIDAFLTDGSLPVPGMMARVKEFDHRGTTCKSAACAKAA